MIVPVVVWLIDLYQWRTTLIILGLGMWILGVPLSFVIRDKPEQYGYLPDGKSSQESETQPNSNGKEVEVGFMQAVRQRAFLYLILAEGIRMMAVYSVITHSMPYFSSAGNTEEYRRDSSSGYSSVQYPWQDWFWMARGSR